MRGKPALREYFGHGLATYPTLHFEFIQIYPGAGYCVLEYRSVNRLRAAEVEVYRTDRDGAVLFTTDGVSPWHALRLTGGESGAATGLRTSEGSSE